MNYGAAPVFATGDRVVMVNDYGIAFGGKTVREVARNPVRGWTYYIAPTDTPWFDVNERNLALDGDFYRRKQ